MCLLHVLFVVIATIWNSKNIQASCLCLFLSLMHTRSCGSCCAQINLWTSTMLDIRSLSLRPCKLWETRHKKHNLNVKSFVGWSSLRQENMSKPVKDRAFILSSGLGIGSTSLMDIHTSTAAHCPCTPSDADGHTLTLTGPSVRNLSWCQSFSVNWFWAMMPAAKDRAECIRAVKREIMVGVVTQKIQRAMGSHREPQRATESHREPQRAIESFEEASREIKRIEENKHICLTWQGSVFASPVLLPMILGTSYPKMSLCREHEVL